MSKAKVKAEIEKHSNIVYDILHRFEIEDDQKISLIVKYILNVKKVTSNEIFDAIEKMLKK